MWKYIINIWKYVITYRKCCDQRDFLIFSTSAFASFTVKTLEAWKAENYAKDKFRVKRLEKLEDAAKALREGEITSGEFRELADAYMPIVPIEEMPNFPTKQEVVQALHATDKRKVQKGVIGVNKTIKDGTPNP